MHCIKLDFSFIVTTNILFHFIFMQWLLLENKAFTKIVQVKQRSYQSSKKTGINLEMSLGGGGKKISLVWCQFEKNRFDSISLYTFWTKKIIQKLVKLNSVVKDLSWCNQMENKPVSQAKSNKENVLFEKCL